MNQAILWQSSSRILTIDRDRVHIWRANLNLPREQVQKLINLLSFDELERANRYKFEKHRNRFIVARSTLRKILSIYLNIEPDRLEFEYSDRGKPFLVSFQQDNWQFNLSHSEELAVYAISTNNSIGIDLEYIRTMPDAENIAKRFFAGSEYQWISSFTGEAQTKAFFRCWTAKEAYLKATGEGIAGGLERLQINFADADLLQFKDLSNWLLHNFVPQPGYLATVAVENSNNAIDFSYWQLENY
jgi:4'-phosphopantetheinyl transferase